MKKRRVLILKVKESMTEEEGGETFGTYTRNQDKLLDVMSSPQHELPQWPVVLVQIQQAGNCSWSNRPSSSSNKLYNGRNNLMQKRATRTNAEGERMAGGTVEESDEWEMHLREEQRLMLEK